MHYVDYFKIYIYFSASTIHQIYSGGGSGVSGSFLTDATDSTFSGAGSTGAVSGAVSVSAASFTLQRSVLNRIIFTQPHILAYGTDSASVMLDLFWLVFELVPKKSR